MMFRVVMYTHSARPSGAELFLARVAEHLHACEVLVVLGEHGPLETVLAQRGIETLVQPLGLGLGQYRARSSVPLGAPLSALRAARQLAGLLRDRSIDVIYTHSAKAHLIGGIAGRLAGVPVVSHAHDLLDARSRGKAGAWVQRLGFALLPSARIANSRLTRDTAGWVNRLPWSVVPCPIDVERRFRPGDAYIEDSRPIRLLVLGRIAEWKGQALALAAVAQLVRDGRDVVLDLVGEALFPADAAYRDRLIETASDLGIADRVRLLGHQRDPYPAIRSAHLVLHTSITPEPFGQVVLEAMSVGRPVIVADSAGVIDELTPWSDCVSYAAGNVGALAQSIERLIDDVALRRQIGLAAIRTARQFTAERVVPKVEAVLLAAAAKSASASVER